MSEPRKSEKPHDRLTRICDAMSEAMENHPEYREGDKCIIFADDDEMGGMVLSGYDDAAEAMTSALLHVRALCQAHGKTLDLGFLGPDGFDFV